jgi:hypothetical protein
MEDYWEVYNGPAAFKHPNAERQQDKPSDYIAGVVRQHFDEVQNQLRKQILDTIADNLERCSDHEHYNTLKLFVHTMMKDIANVKNI